MGPKAWRPGSVVMPRLTLSAMRVQVAPALKLLAALVPSMETVSGSRLGESLAVAIWMPVTMLGPSAGVT
jgi:hypothetical protein